MDWQSPVENSAACRAGRHSDRDLLAGQAMDGGDADIGPGRNVRVLMWNLLAQGLSRSPALEFVPSRESGRWSP